MKAGPALLALLSASILAMAAPTEEPSAPAPPPTVFAQPAGKIKLRLDGKAFLLPEELKPTVTRLMGEANYVQTRELYQALRRGLTEQALAEMRIRQSEALALAASERLEAVRRKHAALKEKLTAMLHDPESAPGADLNSYVQLETAVAAAAAQGEREEEIVATAQAKAEAVRAKAEPTLEATRKQVADYTASLQAYERPLRELRALAATKGTAL